MSRPAKATSRWVSRLNKSCVIAMVVIVLPVVAVRSVDKFPAVNIPAPAVPMRNAFDLYARAGAMVPHLDPVIAALKPSQPNKSSSQRVYTVAEQAAVVAQYQPALDLVRAGFAYPSLAPREQYLATDKQREAEKSGLRNLAYLLVLDGQVKSGHGRWAACAASDLDAIQLGSESERGASLMGFLTGRACEAIGRRQLWRAVDNLTAPEARAAASRLAAIDAHSPSYADALTVQKWETQAALPVMSTAVIEEASLIGHYGGGLAHWLELLYVPKKTVMNDLTAYTDAQIALANLPYAVYSGKRPTPGDFVISMFADTSNSPNPPRFAETMLRTQNTLLITTLALRAYYAAHGAYPDTLSQLVPAWLPAVPADPFALKSPLTYRHTGKNYLLYSIGPDGQDDGGRAAVHILMQPYSFTEFVQNRPMSPRVPRKSVPYAEPGDTGDIVAGITNVN